MLASELVRRLENIIRSIGDKEILVDDKEINGITDITEGDKKYYNMLTSPKTPRKLPM